MATIASSPAHSLSIAVVGAGIAGLTAALYLEREGHHITIYEQSRLATEIGAAFHITPNACKILTDLGIQPVQGGAVYFQESVFLDDQSGRIVNRMPKNAIIQEQLPKGEDWLLCHRYHLHLQLKDLVEQKANINLITSKRVVKAESHHKTNLVVCEDGTTHEVDVIIGADGVHSKIRESLYPEIKSYPTPWAAFRFIIDRTKIAKHALCFSRELFHSGTMYVWGKPETTFLVYPVTNDTQWNFVCLFRREVLDIDAEHDHQYSKPATKDQLKHVYQNFEPQVQELIRLADEEHLRYWPLMDLPNLPSYVSDNIALIGDSAHPFLPFAYQGAGLAIEDGASIGALLPCGTQPEDVPGRLKLFEELRHKRCSQEQQFSRDLFRDHSEDLAWDPKQAFQNIYLYRVVDEAQKLKVRHGIAG